MEIYLSFVHFIFNLKTESEAFATAFGRQPKESVISSLGRVVKVLGSWPHLLARRLSPLWLRSKENYSLQIKALENYEWNYL